MKLIFRLLNSILFIIIIIIYEINTFFKVNLNRCIIFNNFCVKNRIKSYLVKYSILSKTVVYDAINFHINNIVKYKIKNHYYIALDKESFYIMNKYTSHIFTYFININYSNEIDFGSKNYKNIVITKTIIGNFLLNLNKEVLLIDIDIIFFNNPLRYIIYHTEDLIITLDGNEVVNTGF